MGQKLLLKIFVPLMPDLKQTEKNKTDKQYCVQQNKR